MKTVLALFMLPVITLQGVSGEEWNVIYNPESACRYVGSTVDLSCSYTYPSRLTFKQAYWIRRSSADSPDLSQETAYRNRAQVNCRHKQCSLRINSLTASDSGSYYCRITTDTDGQRWIGALGSRLEVRARPQRPSVSISSPPGKLYEGTAVTLTCTTNEHHPAVTSYSWYKTGSITPLQQDQRNTYTIRISSDHNGRYYCETSSPCGILKSYQVDLQVVYGPKNTKVVVDPSGQIHEGSRVTLTCSTDADPPPHTYSWYKRGESTPLNTGKILTFNSIQPENHGDYYCRAVNRIGQQDSTVVSVQVSYGPKDTKVMVDPPGQIREGSRVTLTCSTDANPPAKTYNWYKKGKYTPLPTEKILNFDQIQPENSGQYYCRAGNGIGQQHDSPSVFVEVLYGPKNTKVVVVPPGQIREGSRVTLTCSTDANPPPHTYTWYKKGESTPLQMAEKFLTFSNIQPENRGDYSCRAVNTIGQQDSPVVSVQVSYKPKKTAIVNTPSGVIHKGGSVSLTCSSDANPPVENYTWFKVDESTPVGSGQQFTISNIRSEDAGQYYCEARNTHGAGQSSTVSITVEGGQSHVMIAVVAVAVCGVICLLAVILFLRMRKKRQQAAGQAPQNPGSQPQSRRGRGRGQEDDEEDNDDVQYATIQPHCSRQTTHGGAQGGGDDVQYATIQLKQPGKAAGGQGGGEVQYASIHFKKAKGAKGTPVRPERELSPVYSSVQPKEDPSVVYSSVQNRAV